MDEFSTVVSKNQEPEEQAEGERGDDEEVDGDNLADMRLQEAAPRRGGPRRAIGEVLAAWIVDCEPPLDLAPLSVTRFAAQSEDELRRDAARQYHHFYGTAR